MKTPDQDLESLFHRALRRIRRGAAMTIQGSAFAGALLATAPMTGCTDQVSEDDEVDPGSGGKADDWAQSEGERRTDLVSFTGESWAECRDMGSRGGCYGFEAILKVMITPVADVSPTAKKVGVVHRSVESFGPEQTANGRYFSTHADGREEWHVPVRVGTFDDLFKFNVFYQPGNNKTYFDDNNGELHLFSNDNAAQIIQAMPYASYVSVTDNKVRGKLRVRVADIDHDKIVGMHATIDGWTTTLEFGIGQPGEKNKFYWVEDASGNTETWEIDLELDGAGISELRYAVFYEHGVVNDARRYRFWDNAGGSDYRVIRGTGGSPGTRG